MSSKRMAWCLCSPLLLLTVVGCSDDDPTCPTAPAQALAQLDLSRGGGSSVVVDSVDVSVSVGIASTNEQTVFDVRLANEDEGRSIRIDASNNPDFAAAMVILSNGDDDHLGFSMAFPGGGIGTGSNNESYWINGGLTGDYEPDLAGAEISYALLFVDDIDIESPGSDPNSNGVWTDAVVEMRLVIMGRP